jgi:GT2 family glycosyltransferase
MTVSIIIAVKTWQKNLEECVGKCLQLNYPDFEIIILPDEPIDKSSLPSGEFSVPCIKIIPTGPLNPGQKRDMAISQANGDILAFIDDDAYPDKDWLKQAVKNFTDPEVAAVGGPAVTPCEDTLRQKASGLVYSAFVVSGNYSYRYLPKKTQSVEDYPSCNFLVRKSTMQDLCGFNTNFWPGEDTKFCLDITKKLGKKIVYDPKALAYHHRRPLFSAHLNQAANYGLHRGYFVKRFPETSFKVSYFIPTLFLLSIILGGALSIFFPWLRIAYFLGLSIYLILVFIFSIYKDLRLIPLVFSGIILTHVVYGFYFLKGLLSLRLKEE